MSRCDGGLELVMRPIRLKTANFSRRGWNFSEIAPASPPSLALRQRLLACSLVPALLTALTLLIFLLSPREWKKPNSFCFSFSLAPPPPPPPPLMAFGFGAPPPPQS